jgi:hypothetical protein
MLKELVLELAPRPSTYTFVPRDDRIGNISRSLGLELSDVIIDRGLFKEQIAADRRQNRAHKEQLKSLHSLLEDNESDMNDWPALPAATEGNKKKGERGVAKDNAHRDPHDGGGSGSGVF